MSCALKVLCSDLTRGTIHPHLSRVSLAENFMDEKKLVFNFNRATQLNPMMIIIVINLLILYRSGGRRCLWRWALTSEAK